MDQRTNCQVRVPVKVNGRRQAFIFRVKVHYPVNAIAKAKELAYLRPTYRQELYHWHCAETNY